MKWANQTGLIIVTAVLLTILSLYFSCSPPLSHSLSTDFFPVVYLSAFAAASLMIECFALKLGHPGSLTNEGNSMFGDTSFNSY